MSEISLRWKLDAIRNTTYLYLKHYSPFGKACAALKLKLTLFVDVGLLSAIRRPTRTNVEYFVTGLRWRASAYGHYLKYRAWPGIDSADTLRNILDADLHHAGSTQKTEPAETRRS